MKNQKNRNFGVTVLCPAAINTNINRAQRNRPDALSDTSDALDAQGMALLDRSFDGGTDPRDFGAMVLGAIRNDLPYVIPHQEFEAAYRDKVEGILDIWSGDAPPAADRKSVGWGKSVDLGGRRIIKKKT